MTFEAVRSALDALREAAPDWEPRTHTDVGGGTGAASWAVAEAWEEQPPRTTVLDWAELLPRWGASWRPGPWTPSGARPGSAAR